VAQAARDAVARGNAVDAVVTAVLVAAAEAPGVFLGPLQLLVGGVGAGLQAFDGRVRQPGLGIPRPRGIQVGEPVPPPARIGVPALPAALAAVLAALGATTLKRAAGPAIERARTVSPERAAVLEVFARRGAAAMGDDALASELAAVAGRAAGGTLTQDDLAAVRPGVVTCDERSLAPSGILRVPWREPARGGTTTQVIAAADGRGLVAIACYEVPLDGVPIPSLGLVAPAFASPVLRGEARVRPGEPCPAPAPIALRTRRGVVDVAIGVAEAPDAETALESLLAKLDDAAALLEAIGGAPGRPVAVVRTGDTAAVVASR
jgi:gamma-glutamyltranspeptidase/glutathione hydrolase